MNINEAIKTAKTECKNEYAQAYLKAIPDSIELAGSNGLEVQLLYVLNNMATWRGENAREAKKVMREYIKNIQKMKK